MCISKDRVCRKTPTDCPKNGGLISNESGVCPRKPVGAVVTDRGWVLPKKFDCTQGIIRISKFPLDTDISRVSNVYRDVITDCNRKDTRCLNWHYGVRQVLAGLKNRGDLGPPPSKQCEFIGLGRPKPGQGPRYPGVDSRFTGEYNAESIAEAEDEFQRTLTQQYRDAGISMPSGLHITDS